MKDLSRYLYGEVLEGLSKDLGEWLDREPLADFSEGLRSYLGDMDPVLIYDICNFIHPNKRNEGKTFNIKKIARFFTSDYHLSWKEQGWAVRNAAVGVVWALMEREILVHKKSGESKWPVGQNASLVFAGGDKMRASFYETLAQFGEEAGVRSEEIDKHLLLAKTARKRNAPADDWGLI